MVMHWHGDDDDTSTGDLHLKRILTTTTTSSVDAAAGTDAPILFPPLPLMEPSVFPEGPIDPLDHIPADSPDLAPELPLEQMTITKTIRITIAPTCQPSYNPDVETVFAANISGSTVPMPNATLAIDYHEYSREPIPEGTIRPITMDPHFLGDLLRFSMDAKRLRRDYEEVFASTLAELQDDHPDLDWDDISDVSHLLRRHRPELDRDTAIKHAVIWRMENPLERQIQTPLIAAAMATGTSISTVVSFGGSTFQMTKPTETRGDQVFVATNVPAFNLVEAAKQTPRPHPPACHKHGFKHECRVQQCMLNYVYPIPVTTIFPGIYEQKRDNSTHIGYFMQVTTLTNPHWGTSKSDWTYWPVQTKVATVSGIPFTKVVRDTSGLGHGLKSLKSLHHRAGDPECHSYDTCCDFCETYAEVQHKFWRKDNSKMWMLAALLAAGLTFLASCVCCCSAWFRGHRRRKANPNLSRWEAIPIFGRAFRNDKAEPNAAPEVVEVVQPQALNGLATTVPAAATGAATGAAASGTGNAADGRGTLGRQAEEGRGRVNFAEGTQGGSGVTSLGGASGAAASQGGPGQAVVVTQDGQQAVVNPGSSQQATTATDGPASGAMATGHETAPQVQPTSGPEMHRVDGAADYPTGSEVADIGSMRGRKKGRKDMRGTFLAVPDIVS